MDAVAEDRRQNFVPGADRPAEGAGDLTETDAGAVIDRDLNDAKVLSRRFDLHLDGPAEIGIAHAKLLKRSPRNRPEGTKIGVLVPEQHAHQEAGKLVPKDRLGEQ